MEVKTILQLSEMSFEQYALENGLRMGHHQTRARPIIVDGSNVGLDHGEGIFSFHGIVLVVADWQRRGHRVEVIMPPEVDPNPGSHRAVMLDLAARVEGLVITLDTFMDLHGQQASWDRVIEERLLPQMFLGPDRVVWPQFPYGHMDDWRSVEEMSSVCPKTRTAPAQKQIRSAELVNTYYIII